MARHAHKDKDGNPPYPDTNPWENTTPCPPAPIERYPGTLDD